MLQRYRFLNLTPGVWAPEDLRQKSDPVTIMNESGDIPTMPIQPPIEVTGDLLRLVEKIAEFNHESWMRERNSQGWKLGVKRDDVRKEHPLMVPYAALSEEEKKFNRVTALESVRNMLEMGFRMTGPKGRAITEDFAGHLAFKVVLDETIKQIRKNSRLTTADLRAIWENHSSVIWSESVEVYRLAVDAALRLGEAFLAFDISVEGLDNFKDDLRLTQLQALALARTGATRQANLILDKLRQTGHLDEETIGLLARTHKDFSMMALDQDEKNKHLITSFDLYRSSFERNRGYYSGINAATMGYLSGAKEVSQRLAREVKAICEKTLSDLPEDSDEGYWLEATIAEAAIILEDFVSADTHYRQATRLAGDKLSALSRTRAQARMLLDCITGNPGQLDACFKLPKIVVFSGHMFDRPGRKKPRFPVADEALVRQQIADHLQQVDAQIGFSSLACGSDMLFAEELLKRGGEIHIVLPFNKQDFYKCSVSIIAGMDLVERFEHIYSKAATVTILSETGDEQDGATFEYCNRALIGLSLLKGMFFGMDVVPMAVWNGQTGDGGGGTFSFVNYWWSKKQNVRIICLNSKSLMPSAEQREVQFLSYEDTTVTGTHRGVRQEIKAMLFADIVGYTRLSEKQVPLFVNGFLGEVAKVMNGMSQPPIHQNTWGDAICCVFDSVRDAGIFSLKLRDLVLKTDWCRYGLPAELNIRIALHAGPVYPCYDPVLRKRTYNGSHVNRTARIEPVAEEGQIYASQAFAALATAEEVMDFSCDYVGTRQLAKKYGAIPVFLVRSLG